MNLLDVSNLLKYMHSTYLKVWYNNTLPLRFSKVAEQSEEIRLSEKMVQAIWNDGKFLKENLVDDNDSRIKVIYPGEWNREPGPDFKKAIIEIKGQRFYGDVEIHLSPGHWKSHGHHYDPNYKNVILHVVWEMKGHKFPPNIPHLELSTQLSVSEEKVWDLTNISTYSKARIHPAVECSELISLISDESIKTVFRAAGMSRLHRKSMQFKHSINKYGLNQAFYLSLADALGYKNNRVQFKQLCKAADLNCLQNLNNNAERAAFLWGQSGLLPDCTQETVHEELNSLVDSQWKTWWPLRKEANNNISWNRTSLRPLNSPERRLAALQCILEKFSYNPQEILWNCLKLISNHSALDEYLKTVFEFDSCWTNFCNFKTKLKNPSRLIGQSRRLDIIINIILPALSAIIDENDQHSLNSLYLYYCKLPKSQDNHLLDIAAHKFFIPPYRAKEIIKRAVEQQGLMQLMQDFELPERPDEILSFWEELGISFSRTKNDYLDLETV